MKFCIVKCKIYPQNQISVEIMTFNLACGWHFEKYVRQTSPFLPFVCMQEKSTVNKSGNGLILCHEKQDQTASFQKCREYWSLTYNDLLDAQLVFLRLSCFHNIYIRICIISIYHTQFELTECGSVHGDCGVHFTANWKVLLLNVHLWTPWRQNQTALIVSFSRHDFSFIY